MEGLPKPRRYFAMVALCLGTSLGVLDGYIVSIALPTLSADLAVRPSEAVLVVTVYQLGLVMTILPFSALGERIGLRRLYQYGQWTFLAASILCFLATRLSFLLCMRFFQALGAAAALSVATALIRETYPRRQLGRGLALNNVVVSSSMAAAPVIGGAILSFLSWRYIFMLTPPLALLSIWLGRRHLPDPVHRPKPYDVAAAALCAATLGLTIGGIEAGVHGGHLLLTIPAVLAGLSLGAAFVRRELKSDAPILPVDLLAHPVIGLAVLAAHLTFIGSSTLMLSLPFRLQAEYGFSPAEVAAAILPWPLTMIVVAPLAAELSDRYRAPLLGSIGMVIATVGVCSLALLPRTLNHWHLAWRMMLVGTGYGMFFSPNARTIVQLTPAHRVASAGGLISTTRLVSQTLGATLLAALLSFGVGATSVTAWVVAGLTLTSLACNLFRLRISH